MTRKRWEGIVQCKQDFLDNKLVDPRESPYLSPEVADSWIRSRKAGIDPENLKLGKQLSAHTVEESQEENRLLIEFIKSMFDHFEVPSDLAYRLTLDDKNGIPLYRLNDNYTIEERKFLGKVFDENVAGTTAHILCRRLKRPVQLMGPEHYSKYLEDFVVTSVPILDRNGEVDAVISLAQPLIHPPWDPNFQIICYNTFALVTAMAAAIENRIQLEESYNELEDVNNLLKNTLAVIDEGIITIDEFGNIINLNEEGAAILKINSQANNQIAELKTLNFKNFLSKNSPLMASVRAGYNMELEEIVHAGDEGKSYLIHIHPIVKQDTSQVKGAVLRLNLLEKVNVQAAVRAGNAARFSFDNLIGQSPAFKKAVKLGQVFAGSSENILLIGESGTGKELYAQAIHNNNRPKGPFMAVNCAALPRELIESELFGYEGGSFTGADRNGRPGKIELANGGTLFLDEIGDMPYELQAVLLRVLQDKQVMRIGGQTHKKVNFRVIAATNQNLWELVEKNLFRADLYYRLSVLSIDIPPLRERGSDIALLSNYFVQNYCQKTGIKASKIHPETQKILDLFSWPGNVRQLENTIIYAVNIANGKEITIDHLPNNLLTPKKENAAINQRVFDLRDLEKVHIEEALSDTNNNIPKAASLLGVSKSTLYRKLKEYKIDVQ
ncbi:sigma 54-interacting transcriptional regulator [Dehalobacter sp. DCM]|uniref:sigma-54 interaction domain-containing protein n=1 Tax=Dehalobacter sp. DCM TaxID=2907827 RepID=UPI003081D4F3|nr:sigma 54-interacting transcriptional regulator [Dehalobacter sp. DCM]